MGSGTSIGPALEQLAAAAAEFERVNTPSFARLAETVRQATRADFSFADQIVSQIQAISLGAAVEEQMRAARRVSDAISSHLASVRVTDQVLGEIRSLRAAESLASQMAAVSELVPSTIAFASALDDQLSGIREALGSDWLRSALDDATRHHLAGPDPVYSPPDIDALSMGTESLLGSFMPDSATPAERTGAIPDGQTEGNVLAYFSLLLTILIALLQHASSTNQAELIRDDLRGLAHQLSQLQADQVSPESRVVDGLVAGSLTSTDLTPSHRTTRRAHLRKLPHASSPSLTRLSIGSELLVLGRRSGWVRVLVTSESNEVGWVYARFARPIGDSQR